MKCSLIVAGLLVATAAQAETDPWREEAAILIFVAGPS
jgi:hypothetical protein